MAIKFIKKNQIIITGYYTILIQLLFYYSQQAITLKKSAFSINFLLMFLHSPKAIFFFLITLVALFFLKYFIEYSFKIITFLFLTNIIVCLIHSINTNDKWIITTSFIFTILSILYLLLFHNETKFAFLNPGYSKYDIVESKFYDIPCYLVHDNDKVSQGLLMNWDSESCFIKIPKMFSIANKEVIVEVHYCDKVFREKGTIVTSYTQGCGVLFSKDHQSHAMFSWSSLYDILSTRGYSPNYKRNIN